MSSLGEIDGEAESPLLIAVNHTLPHLAAAENQSLRRLYYPEWCAAPLFGWYGEDWLEDFCEMFIGSPFWTTTLILDCIALWLIYKILMRQREQGQEYFRVRKAVPISVRVRRNWSLLATMARLTTMEQIRSNSCSERKGDRKAWADVWKTTREMREYRKTSLMKMDFHLPGVMMRAAGAVIVLVMTLLILFEVRAFYMVALPYLDLGPWLANFLGGLAMLFTSCIFYNYANVSLRDPGFTHPGLQPVLDLDAAGCSTDELERSELGKKAEALRCTPCNAPKPQRCHHCKVCRRCILKMDHHCPFVNNCIGARNHRYFMMFLMSLVVGCAFLFLCLVPQINYACQGWGTLNHPWTRAHRVHIVLASIVALFACCTLGPFFWFHLRLVLVNQTTLERMKVMANRRYAEKNGVAPKTLPEEGYSRGILADFVEIFGTPPRRFRRQLKLLLEKIAPADAKRSA